MSTLRWIGVIFVVFILIFGILNLFGLDMDIQLEESFTPNDAPRVSPDWLRWGLGIVGILLTLHLYFYHGYLVF